MIRLALFGVQDDVGGWTKVAQRIGEVSVTAIADIEQLSDDRVDAVVVCSADGRGEACLAAAARGKHVFLVVPPESCDLAAQLNDACLGRVRLMVGSDRCRPSVREIKRSLDAGQLGDPGLMRIHRWQSDAPVDPTAEIDLALWMFGVSPNTVYAVAKPDADNVEYLQIHLGFRGGGMGLIDVSNSLLYASKYYSLSLIGSTGAAYADDHRNQQLLFRSDNPRALTTSEGDAARAAQLQEFVDAISEQREADYTAADALAALSVRDSVLESIKCARPAGLVG